MTPLAWAVGALFLGSIFFATVAVLILEWRLHRERAGQLAERERLARKERQLYRIFDMAWLDEHAPQSEARFTPITLDVDVDPECPPGKSYLLDGRYVIHPDDLERLKRLSEDTP